MLLGWTDQMQVDAADWHVLSWRRRETRRRTKKAGSTRLKLLKSKHNRHNITLK